MGFLSATRRPAHSSSFLLRLISTTSTTTTTDTTTTTTTAATTHAYDPTIRRLARSGKFSDIESLLKNNPSLPQETLIKNYTSAGMIDHALPLVLTTQTLNALLSACNRTPNLSRRVPDLFSQFTTKTSNSISPDLISYSILIKSLCRSRDSNKALKLLQEMESKKIKISVVTYTTILDSLYKEEKPVRAEALWAEMLAKGLEPDTTAYNVRIMHRARAGKTDAVLKLMAEMEEKELKHDTITYNYLIQCYCKEKRFEEAKTTYLGIEKPNYVTYRNYVRELCKNGDVEEAVKVYEDGVKRGIVPDLWTVKLLVEELVKRKKGRAAKRVVTGLKHKFAEDFKGGWLELEKLVGLDKGKDGKEEEEDSVVVAT